MIQVTNKEQCCGCGSCHAACPRNCIEMREDTEGFLYPHIDKTACVECGICERVCPFLSTQKNFRKPEAWACVCKEEAIRHNSSSGGIFTLLAERILEQEGIVYGASFDRSWNVTHIPVEQTGGLEKLRGSKYVQSRIGDCYRDAEFQLESGRKVFFSGTPCQIDGLKAYLKKDYDNLYCQDIICHGVPSPLVWQMYLKSLRAQDEWHQISFRLKNPGWKDYHVSISDGIRRLEQHHLDNPYMKLFLNDISLRPSCYQCHSKGYGRHSDLTLGDLWGAEKAVPDMDDDRGLSLVLVQSPKGKQLLEETLDRMSRRQVNLKIVTQKNPSILWSAKCPSAKRKQLFPALLSEDFTEEDFARLTQKLTRKSVLERGKEVLWNMLHETSDRTQK